MMSRERFENLVEPWALGELAEQEASEFESLLEANPEWRHEANRERNLARLVQSARTPKAPADLMDAVMKEAGAGAQVSDVLEETAKHSEGSARETSGGIQIAPGSATDPSRSIRSGSKNFWMFAAAAAVVVAVAIGGLMVISGDKDETQIAAVDDTTRTVDDVPPPARTPTSSTGIGNQPSAKNLTEDQTDETRDSSTTFLAQDPGAALQAEAELPDLSDLEPAERRQLVTDFALAQANELDGVLLAEATQPESALSRDLLTRSMDFGTDEEERRQQEETPAPALRFEFDSLEKAQAFEQTLRGETELADADLATVRALTELFDIEIERDENAMRFVVVLTQKPQPQEGEDTQ